MNELAGTGAQAGSSEASARAAYLLRRAALDRVGAALSAAGLEALLVKGAGLAETVYSRPWTRAMTDVDLVVPPSALVATLEAFAQGGISVLPVPAERRRSFSVLGERVALVAVGPATWTVEIHTDLDRVAPRPIDWAAIRARAGRVEGLPESLKVPALEDHAALVVLHAVLSGLHHEPAWKDLDALVQAGADARVVVERCRAWGLATAAAVTFEAQQERAPRPGLAPAASALGVSAWRRALARRALRGRAPARGVAWMIQQAAVRDDPFRWCAGVLRYAALRGLDRWPW